jgi:hypothetical protein
MMYPIGSIEYYITNKALLLHVVSHIRLNLN